MTILQQLKLFLRSESKQKLSSLLGIFSITIGMVACLFIAHYVQYEKNFDRNWSQSDNIYRIAIDQLQTNGVRTQSAQSFLGLSQVLEAELPEVAGVLTVNFRNGKV